MLVNRYPFLVTFVKRRNHLVVFSLCERDPHGLLYTNLLLLLYIIFFLEFITRVCVCSVKFKGAFHSPELDGQTIHVVMRISLLIKTIQPHQSNHK